jgi:hypothetical protein
MGFFTFENFASRATDATRRDKAWDRARKLRLVMRNRTILVWLFLFRHTFYQKVDGSGVRVSAGSTLGPVTFLSLVTQVTPLNIDDSFE